MSDGSSLKFGRYQEAILEFIKNNGIFITYSQDNNIINTLAGLIKSNLGVQQNCILNLNSQAEVENYLRNREVIEQEVFIFVERIYNGYSTVDFLSKIKEKYKNIYIVLLTDEVESAALVRFYELGVENFITKPFNRNTLLEKIAFTLRPQSKIGEHLDRARSLMENKQYDRALEKCDEVLKIKPNSASAFMTRGDIFREQGFQDQAIAEYNKAHQNSSLYLEPLKKLIQYYAELGWDKERLQFLEKLDHISPLNLDRKVEIGSLHVKMQEKEAGKKYFDEALSIVGRQVKDILGSQSLQIAEAVMPLDNAFAEQYYRKALQIKGDQLDLGDVETVNRLAICLRQQKKPEQAIKEYNKALNLAPDNSRLIYNLAMAYLEAGYVDQSKEQITKLLEIYPAFYKTSEVVCYNIGIIFVYCKEKEEAAKYFNEALKISPEYGLAKKMLNKLNQ